MRPLIHIGYHKTGTTFLQKRVFTEEKTFFNPWARSGTPIDHIALAHPLRFDPAAVRAEFYSSRADTDERIPVVSHEGLSGVPFRGRYYGELVPDRLSKVFPDARILIGIREQKTMLLSLYAQYVSQGGHRSLSDLLGPRERRPGFLPALRLDHLEYDLMLDLYRDRFGPESVLMLPLEILSRTPQEYHDRLAAFLEVDLAPLSQQRVNPRRGALVTEFERLLNRALPETMYPPRRYADRPLSFRFRKRSTDLAQRSLGRLPYNSRLLANQKSFVESHVGDYFAASNAHLAEKTGLDLQSLGYDVAKTA
jgi:hypothetical protein